MLESSVRICDAKFGGVYRCDADTLSLIATHNLPQVYAQIRRDKPFRLHPGSVFGDMVATKSVVHSSDLASERYYLERRDPATVAAVELGGVRTVLAIPMLKENEIIGILFLCRQEVRPFTDKQIGLIKTFAAQAVIAIENARLLNELRERTEDVVKLNQQLEQRVADQVGEIERMSRLRRFLPPQVADLIVASGAEKQLESHRREITALFCDLARLHRLLRKRRPGRRDGAVARLSRGDRRDNHQVQRHAGTVRRRRCHGRLQRSHAGRQPSATSGTDGAGNAYGAIGALTDKWRRLGHDIGFGIGIAHGFATLGTIGFEGRFDYAAIGTVSNVASRLCDEAKPGQILISPRVLMAVEARP